MNSLIVYTTKGCFACNIMKRICDEVAVNFDNITRRNIDIDSLPFGVIDDTLKSLKDFPTTIFNHEGKEMFRLIGTYPTEYIKNCIDNALTIK